MIIKLINEDTLIVGEFKLKCCLGKKGISKNKFEGDLTTPKGDFELGLLYYRKDRITLPKCKIKKRVIKKNMGWCDDSNNKKYNKEIKFPFKSSAEKLYRREKIYDLLIVIKYNFRPAIKKRGSAIFLHLADKKYKPTKGCIAIKKKDFIKILPLITNKTKISIG